MAVLGRLLVSSAERIDLPDLLSIDSYSAGDFKYFIKGLVGGDKPFIFKGFDVIDPQNAIGTQSCSIRVADSVVWFPQSNSGSFYHGLEEGNANATPLVPELRKNATNYVYATFSTFNTSVDTRAFWDPDKDGGVGGEFTQDVNTESVLKVDINVSTGSFPANTIPIAKIVVGPVVITSITDCRDLMFRLGAGGISPDPFSTFAFRSLPSASYKRSEPSTTMSAGGDNAFQGGDKNIYSLKEWMDVVMTKLKELGGTTFWYEDSSSYNLVSNFIDALATTVKSKGQWVHDSSVPGLVSWTEDLVIKLTQDTRDTIIRAGSKTLANEQVAYIALQRNLPINSSDSAVSWTNGQPYVNTVGGAVGFFGNLSQGDYIKKADDPNSNFLRVEQFYDGVNLGGSTTTAANARSIRLSDTYNGTTEVKKGRYDKGVYQPSDVIVADRDSPALVAAGGNYHWLIIRSDTIENIGSVSSVDITGTMSEADGKTVKVVSTAHGLVDGDMVDVSLPVAQAGTYRVEVEDADTFYIQTTDTTVGAFAGHYATLTTTARDNGYGLQLESANHSFQSGETIIIEGTTNYDGAYVINKRSATQIQFAVPAAAATETTGTATLARVNVRADQGLINIVQGESVDIGEGAAANIRQFIGMASNAEVHPFYAVPVSYNTLDGMANYNGLETDNLTARVSKLTSMMADKTQDKTIKYLPSPSLTTITNTTNGAAQEITFTASGSTLTIATPGSTGNATIVLPDTSPGISLLANQVAYVVIDRNTPTTPTIQIANMSELAIDENTFVIASRLNTTAVYLWEGSIISSGGGPFNPTLPAIVRQNQMLKLVAGGTWAWDLGTETLSWSASAVIQLPSLADSVNTILASSVNIAAGEVAYVNINRTAPGGNLTVSVASNASLITSADTFIIARRDSNDVIVGAHSMRLVDGESKELYAGVSDQLLTFMGAGSNADNSPTYSTAIAHTDRYVADGMSLETGIASLDNELDKLFGQLRIRQATPASTRAIITGADRILLDNTTISQQIQNILLDFDGAQIDFQTGVIYKADGITALGINFTPATIATGQYRYYSVTLVPGIIGIDNRIAAQIQILPASGDGASSSAAPRAQFATGLKLGQVWVQNAGSPGVINNITQANVVQLGVGSGGGSDASTGGNVYEENVDVVISPSGNNQMAAIPTPPALITLPKDRNKLVGTAVLASTDGTTSTITVLKTGHGLTSGDTVTVTTSTAIGGITAGNLSVTDATVTVIDANSFTFPANAASTSAATGYLDRVIATTIRYYSVGDQTLQIDLNGVMQRRLIDWQEVGAPGTQSNSITWLRELVVDDSITYRIDANIGQQVISAGAGGSTSLQGAYDGGSIINTTSGVPLVVNGPAGKIAVFNGDIDVTGVIDPKGITFTPQAASPLGPTDIGFWANLAGEMMADNAGTTVNVSQMLTGGASSVQVELDNNSGALLTKGTPVSIDDNGDLQLVIVSDETNSSAIAGIIVADIADGASGNIITGGKLENITTTAVFGDAIYVSATGGLTSVRPETGVNGFLAGDFVIRLGVITKNRTNPSLKDLLVNITIIGQLE